MGKQIRQPYEAFGKQLKDYRQGASKNQIEVSGAIEVDDSTFADFELGKTRPSTDILLLLIQHFDLDNSQADDLWRLAGYEGRADGTQYFDDNDLPPSPANTQKVRVSAHDARIVYTDMVQVMVNNYGVIVNFMQGAGPGSSPLAVSRVGMSKEHARSLIGILQTTLEKSENIDSKAANVPKQLSSGGN